MRLKLCSSIGTGVALALALQSGFAWAENRPDASTYILSAFTGACGSQGLFTQSAQTQTASLIGIIETLKATDACKPFVNQISILQNAASQINSLQTSASSSTYQTDFQNYQLLTLALANAKPGSDLATALQAQMITLRQTLLSDQASYNVATRVSRHNTIVSNASALLSWEQQLATTSTSPSLLQCLRQSPLAALELGTNLAAFGSSFLPVVYGATVGAVGQLFNTGFEMLRGAHYDNAVFNAQRSQMPDAIECALEAMSESYCAADDAFTLLDLASKNRLKNYAATPLWRGIDILGRQLPMLLQWLNLVQNEAPPGDSYQGAKQISVYQEIAVLQQMNVTAIAAINNAISQATYASTPDAQAGALVTGIAVLALQIAPQTPFATLDTNPMDWACWLTLGINSKCPAIPQGDLNQSGGLPGVLQVEDYLNKAVGINKDNPTLIAATMASLLNNWNGLLPSVQVIASADFARIIATNSGIILSSAFNASKGYPVAPIQVLKNILEFLSGIDAGSARNPQLALTLEQEKHTVSEAIRQLTAPDSEVCPPIIRPKPPGQRLILNEDDPGPIPVKLTPKECQAQRMATLFNLFGLQNGVQVFLTDLTGLVSIDIQNRFSADEIPNDATKILEASGQDLASALAAAGSGDLAPSADDQNDSRGDIEENIQIVRDFFVKEFEKAVDREAAFAAEESITKGANRPHGQKLAQLCLYWLTTSRIPRSSRATYEDWPTRKVKDVCTRTAYFNENINTTLAVPNGRPPGLAFDIGELEEKLNGLPFQERVCTFHKFRISNKADTLFTTAPSGNP